MKKFFRPRCGFQDPRYGVMTNRRYLESLSDYDFAKQLVQMCEEETIEYDWDENPVDGFPYTYWLTSDGENFTDYDEAIEHEVWWLRQSGRRNQDVCNNENRETQCD